MKIVAVKGWTKSHIVSTESRRLWTFLCGREAKPIICTEVENNGSTCLVCSSIFGIGPKCSSSNPDEISVGAILQCPRDVSETGKIKIVGDQTNCASQLSTWDYIVTEYDPDEPEKFMRTFYVSKDEVESWKELYG